MKKLKWMPTNFTWPCPEKIWKMLFFAKNELNGTSNAPNIELIILLRMQPTIFSPELAVMSTRNMTREDRVSSMKSFDVQKCCACAAKHIVTTIESRRRTGARVILSPQPY